MGRIENNASPLWTLQRLCFEPDVAADPSDRGENRDPDTATQANKNVLTKEARLENGPSGAREKMRRLTGESTAIMCPALSTRRDDRWPRWDPRSRPKHGCGFVSRCNKRVHWIVGSTDRHLIWLSHPGINARSVVPGLFAGQL